MAAELLDGGLGVDKIEKRLVNGKDVFIVKKSNEKFVLKMVQREGETGDDEAHLYTKVGLDCPYLLKVVRVSTIGKKQNVLMEYIDGGDLFEKIRKGPVPSETEVFQFTCQGALALETLHKAKIIHKGINPSDFLVVKAGEYKLSDYVAPHVFDPAKPSNAQGYASPEILGGGKTTNKVDIFSFGAVLLHFILGQHPFDGNVAMIKAGKPIDAAVKHAHPCAKLALQLISVDPKSRPSATDILNQIVPSSAFFLHLLREVVQLKVSSEEAERGNVRRREAMRNAPPPTPTGIQAAGAKMSSAASTAATTMGHAATTMGHAAATAASALSRTFSKLQSTISSAASSATSSKKVVDETLEQIMQKQAATAPPGFAPLPSYTNTTVGGAASAAKTPAADKGLDKSTASVIAAAEGQAAGSRKSSALSAAGAAMRASSKLTGGDKAAPAGGAAGSGTKLRASINFGNKSAVPAGAGASGAGPKPASPGGSTSSLSLSSSCSNLNSSTVSLVGLMDVPHSGGASSPELVAAVVKKWIERIKDGGSPIPIYLFPIPKLLVVLAMRTMQHVGVYVEGIFRKSIDQQLLSAFIALVQAGRPEAIVSPDANAYAVVIKTWLRRLPAPLVPGALYDQAVEFAQDDEEEDENAQTYQTYDNFNYYNYSDGNDLSPVTTFVNTNFPLLNNLTMKYLVRFLRIFPIKPYVDTNLMNIDNIALVMAPNVLRTTVEGPVTGFGGMTKLKNEIKFTTLLIRQLCITKDEEALFTSLDDSVRAELAVPEEGCCPMLNYYIWD